MTDLGIEFFEIRSLHCMCSEVSARVDFLLNIFKLSDSSLLGYYVLLSGKELPMFRGVFWLPMLWEGDTIFIPNIGKFLSVDTA